MRRHDGPARRGGVRGALRRLLDRDPLVAAGLPPGHPGARGARGDGRARDPASRTSPCTTSTSGRSPSAGRTSSSCSSRSGRSGGPTSSSSRPTTTSTRITRRSPQEGLRAFKRTTILGYEIPWNNFDFSYGAYLALERRHVERKVAAVRRYASQQHRRYADEEYIWNLARVHGTNVNREFAEVFQVYRLVA